VVPDNILHSYDPLVSVFAGWRRFAAANFVCRLLWLLSLTTFVAGAAAADVQRTSIAPPAPGLPFVIADFDGDLRPDLASIQAARSDSNRAVYWIQLQLTSVGRTSIRVVAPVGGLQILARDVNGDHAVDLVVTTAGLGELVAVFLNDGHGGFSQIDQNAFPVAFSDSATDCAPAAGQDSDAAGVPPQSRTKIPSETKVLPYLRSKAGFVALSNSKSPLDRSLIRHPGRAPPSEVPHL
jgi:hypothetical protein